MRTLRSTVGTVAWLLLLLCGVSGQECTADGSLCDKHERCAVWKDEGECFRSKKYMKNFCPASCSEQGAKPMSTECKDSHPRCHIWAEAGECKENADNMDRYCPKSCGKCIEQDASAEEKEEAEEPDDDCTDSNEKCSFWAEIGECEENPRYMHTHCKKSCQKCANEPKIQTGEKEEIRELLHKTLEFGVMQTADGSEKETTLNVIRESVVYMDSSISDLPQKIIDSCLNRKHLCSFWAAVGECQNNEAYMLTNCAPSCKSCHMIDMASRCPPLEDAKPALKPGQLNEMFQKLIDEAPGNRTLTDDERRELQEKGIPEYTVHVHSRPNITDNGKTKKLSRKVDQASPPWVVTFEDFLTPEECQTLIDLGHEEGYERSKDVGAKENVDGSFDAVESQGRTSENAWCSARGGCRDDETVQKVMNRMGKVLGIDPDNSEDLQLLRYEKSQFYQSHHDYIAHQRDRQCGPRVLTFYLYLSDVEAGGGTKFTELDITVMPKVGRAVLWPSVLNSNPMDKDWRTKHAALPVEQGTKYGANAWIHQFDYLGPQARGCN